MPLIIFQALDRDNFSLGFCWFWHVCFWWQPSLGWIIGHHRQRLILLRRRLQELNARPRSTPLLHFQTKIETTVTNGINWFGVHA